MVCPGRLKRVTASKTNTETPKWSNAVTHQPKERMVENERQLVGHSSCSGNNNTGPQPHAHTTMFEGLCLTRSRLLSTCYDTLTAFL